MVEHRLVALHPVVVIIKRAPFLKNAEVYVMHAIHKIDTPPGPAGQWLIDRLVTLSDEAERPAKEIARPIKRKTRRSRSRSPARRPRR